MSNDAMKSYAPSDGFDDAGGEADRFIRVIQGSCLRFTNEGTWTDVNDEPVPPTLELVVNSIRRVIQKWVGQSPTETRFLESGERMPDIEQLNAACPKSEWGLDFNKQPKGPWQAQHVVYLVDMGSMAKYSFPTATIGGGIAIGELKDSVQLMRRYRGAGVYPVVRLTARHMNTRFGGRERPSFQILRWISFDQDGGMVLPPATPGSLPSPGIAAQAPIEPKAEAKPKATGNANNITTGVRVVAEPTLKEEMNDDIPF
jgi:hypothetical protein